MNFSRHCTPRSDARHRLGLPLLTLALAASGIGCYHATGFQRPPLMVAEIPAEGGDRVGGIKSAAGPGDYYIGNDFIGLSVDGTPFGEREGSTIAGAISGGSVVDAGVVALDSSYKQVPLASDLLERLTPVVNQDPELPIVFSTYTATNFEDRAILEMRGSVYDPAARIAGGTRDASGRIQQVEVVHTLEMGKLSRYVTLETTLKNTGSSSLGIRNIGDALIQQGAGFRLLIPATETLGGQPVTGWGTDFDGSNFSQPLTTSVKAAMVAMMGAEPADYSTDMHSSLGLVAEDGQPLAVAADPQHALTNFRPEFPRRMVAGSLPVDALGAGQSITHRRRLYIYGASTVNSIEPFANQATVLFNRMLQDRVSADKKVEDHGVLIVSPFGSAARTGHVPTLFRFERNLGTTAAPVWKLERMEWWEPMNSPGLGNYYSRLLSSILYSPTQNTFEMILPEGSYRVVAYNGKGERVEETHFRDAWAANERPYSKMPLVVDYEKPFEISTAEVLTPDRDSIVSSTGNQVRPPAGYLTLQTTAANSYAYQPARFTLTGLAGTPDPDLPRRRVVTSVYSAAYKQKLPGQSYTGAYLVSGANSAFGVHFQTGYTLGLPLGQYRTLATHGPLAPLDVADSKLDAYQGSALVNLMSFEEGHPAGWLSFDMPGPTMATSGGIHPFEALSSALAEGVNVLAYTEEDHYPHITRIRDEFRYDFNLPNQEAEYTKILGQDPLMAGARTSRLEGRDQSGQLKAYGTASALFDLNVAPSARRNGARISKGWTLADFLSQGGGTFSVIHDPRGPQGLFTLQGFDRTVALGSGVNAWWNRSSALAMGRTHGSFDALELLRGEGCTPATAGIWWTRFKDLRLDWFALLNQQLPTAFTKALGLSSAHTTYDTPVGLARTYLKASDVTQEKLNLVKEALQKGAAVASTGPLLDVTVNNGGPGALVTGSTLSISITYYAPAWVPVDEVRVVWNGTVVRTLTPAEFTADAADTRKRTATVTLPAPKDGWVVVEAGAPLSATAPYRAGSAWSTVMKGIFPMAVTNPVFVDANGGGYVAPGL